jgi:thiamine pyrophosphokinase
MTSTPIAPATRPGRTHVVVFAGGDPVGPATGDRLPAGAYVIAADSGIEQAQALGWPIDLAVGDFDSVDPDALAAAELAGARVERHPVAKDATDLELALVAAAACHPTEMVVVGGAGGRLDHLLGGLLALTDDAYSHIRVRAEMGAARVFVVRDQVEVTGRLGELVTLLAIGRPAFGVSTSGLRFALRDYTLEPASTRGVSNVLVDEPARVTVTDGLVLVVLPGELAPDAEADASSLRPPLAPDPGGRP